MLRTADLEYELPEDRIATRAAEPRDAARLMVVERGKGGGVEDRMVRELPSLLRPGDLLVFNTTRVIPARFVGKRVGSGGKVEGLYLSEALGGAGVSSAASVGEHHASETNPPPAPSLGQGEMRWHAFIKGRHTRAGAEVELFGRDGGASGVVMRVVGRSEEETGAWVVEVDGAGSTSEVLERVGLTPLPPYILAARMHRAHEHGQPEEPVARGTSEAEDRERYQTVYARQPGSVAAPTAGLHFTQGLLAALDAAGVHRAEVVLHVGSGTFKPVETEFVEQHTMHAEWCAMGAETLDAIRRTRAAGGRVIAVGTTAARTIEAYAGLTRASSENWPTQISTRLLVTPGYRWRWVDGLMTNFHLPRSTLMALVASLLEGDGVWRLKGLYARGVERGYRFYSFGDAMLIL